MEQSVGRVVAPKRHVSRPTGTKKYWKLYLATCTGCMYRCTLLQACTELSRSEHSGLLDHPLIRKCQVARNLLVFGSTLQCPPDTSPGRPDLICIFITNFAAAVTRFHKRLRHRIDIFIRRGQSFL